MNELNLNINLNFQQLLEIVRQLTPMEKLKINESIWDENMLIPIEHQTIVLDRRQKAKTDPTRFIDWEIAIKSL